MSQSLEEVNQSVATENKTRGFRKMLAFLGPAYLISVGYMDPGNWATDLAGGSQFGYSLLWVLLMSNIMALVLQSLSARLGIVTQRDLAQASRETYPRLINYFLYFLAEIAIAACDLAEVLGMAIGLNLLFGLPLIYGVLVTVLDTFLLLYLINKGIRKMEGFIIGLIVIIGVSFIIELFLAQPNLHQIGLGFIPSLPNNAALYIAIGIIGATVMPHNLYLHSSLVQTRKFERTPAGIKQALKYNFIDSAIALNIAFVVNAAILILAAATFYKNGFFHVAEIQDAYRFLEPLLGSKIGPILFAVALIAAGQSSTITGTLAGQIVMEGYLTIRIQPWVRRIITRLLAIIPAVLVLLIYGEQGTTKMLILSQVILSLQLGFAIIPLIHFVSNKSQMKGFHIGPKMQVLCWLIAAAIISLNSKLIWDQLQNWLAQNTNPLVFWGLIIPFTSACFVVLLYITFQPLFVKGLATPFNHSPHIADLSISLPTHSAFETIAIAVDFSTADEKALQYALQLGGKSTSYILIHVVETVGALVYGAETVDHETTIDSKLLADYVLQLNQNGYRVSGKLGFGKPNTVIPQLVADLQADVLIMGTHGHKTLKDLLFGTTVEKVRHAIKIPLLILKN